MSLSDVQQRQPQIRSADPGRTQAARFRNIWPDPCGCQKHLSAVQTPSAFGWPSERVSMQAVGLWRQTPPVLAWYRTGGLRRKETPPPTVGTALKLAGALCSARAAPGTGVRSAARADRNRGAPG